MKYKLLGNTGLRVSQIALGAMTFGEDWGWGSSKEESQRVLDYFIDQGGNFVDTANIYTDGSSEKILGQLIRDKREKVVLATKFGSVINPEDPNAKGASRKNLIQSVDASLKRLGTDYIDLYWLHIYDQHTPAYELMRGLDDLVQAGKILYTGISDTPAWYVSRCQTMAERENLTPFAAIQVEYNLLARTVERELFPLMDAYGMSATVWSPLAAGVLTGKYLDNEKQAGRLNEMDGEIYDKYRGERVDRIVKEVLDIAKAVDASPAQVALAWTMHERDAVIPIVGASKLEHLKDNLQALNVSLSEQHIERLDRVSRIDLGFPYAFYETHKEYMLGNTNV